MKTMVICFSFRIHFRRLFDDGETQNKSALALLLVLSHLKSIQIQLIFVCMRIYVRVFCVYAYLSLPKKYLNLNL